MCIYLMSLTICNSSAENRIVCSTPIQHYKLSSGGPLVIDESAMPPFCSIHCIVVDY